MLPTTAFVVTIIVTATGTSKIAVMGILTWGRAVEPVKL
jgi:hypothetical protein